MDETQMQMHEAAVTAAVERVRTANSEVAAAVEHRARVLTAAHEAGMSWSRLGELLGTTAQTALQKAKPRDIRSEDRAKITAARRGRAEGRAKKAG
jgi:hypothetical protein